MSRIWWQGGGMLVGVLALFMPVGDIMCVLLSCCRLSSDADYRGKEGVAILEGVVNIFLSGELVEK